MSALWQDLRHSVRTLARSPGFTGVAVVTLGLALGANTAIFSVMNAVLLRALPYPEPDRIFDISVLLPPSEGRPSTKALLDSQRLDAWQERTRTLERLAAYRTQVFTLSSSGRPERLTGARVSSSLLPLLRVPPAKGTTFLDEHEKPGSDKVVVLSYGQWQRRFQGDAGIVGKSVILEGAPYTILGVMPASFFFPTREVELWTPLSTLSPALGSAESVDTQYYQAIARLRQSVSSEQAEQEADEIFRILREDGTLPAEERPAGKVRLVSLRDQMVGEARPALLMLSAAVGLVLLIACANVTSLLLARNSARRRELAIRSAVGGNRGRLVRQMLTESTVLSLAGGVVGLLVAGWIDLLLPRLLPPDLPRLDEIRLDLRVFLFSFLLSGATGLLFGLLPALRGARTTLVRNLHGDATDSLSGMRFRSAFVVVEVALAFVLLVGAGLLVRSFRHLVRLDLGYEPDHVLMATLDLDRTRYGARGRTEAFFDELLGRLEESKQVKAAGIVSFAPLTSGFSLTSLEVVGQPPARTLAVPQMTSPGYLEAMGLRLAEGRWLTTKDHTAQAPVAVVNETFVRRLVKRQKAVGRRLQVGSLSLEIVGVVKDVRLLGLESAPKPELFTSYRHAEAVSGASPERMTLMIRTRGDPLALASMLRTLVFELDPGLVLEDVGTMNARLAASMAQPRCYAFLLAAFAGVALVLAAAGVYGVLSYAVARQTREIGMRRALGAMSRDILAMVLRKGIALVLLGLVFGVAAALGSARVLTRFLFGLTAMDPLSYVAAALTLIAIGLLACYLPARRATLVDPVEAIRYDG